MAVTVPTPTAYHRWLGWHAPALRRLAAACGAGIVAGVALAAVAAWQIAVLGAWIATALTFLAGVAPIVLRADSAATARLSVSEDVNRDAARLLLLAASGASLVAVAVALHLARDQGGAGRAVLVAVATLTVVVSWVLVNTVFALRYADLYYGAADRKAGDGVDWGGPGAGPPDYRDFAYLAFTIGMTYQVSDTTLRDRRIRRTVLVHALLSYAFGVVIVAVGVNVVAGLVG